MVLEHESYRTFLKSVLAEKTASSPAFSMNAWAKKIGIAQGFLSEVLSGKKNLSQEACLKIAANLELGAAETEYFSLLVQLATSKDLKVRERLLERINVAKPKQPIHNLQVDLFRAISDWFCAAIVELTYLPDSEFTPKNISKRLGITVLEAESAIERLLRLELLEKSSTGKYSKTTGYLLVESGVPHEAVRNFHRQVLERVIDNLALPSTVRKSRSEVLPISPDILPEVERILDEASERIRSVAKKSKRKREVYSLSLQFSPLTKKERNSV